MNDMTSIAPMPVEMTKPQSSVAVSWSTLAITRFFLATIVVHFHMVVLFGATGWPHIFQLLGGKAAVIGFLAISGFSIHSSLHNDSGSFLKRRFLRIYPAYIFALAASFALQFAPLQLNEFFSKDTILTYFLNAIMLQMFVSKAINYDLAVWSLSIEFSFYVFAYLTRFADKRLIFAACAVSIVLFCLPPHLNDSVIYALAIKFKPTKYLWAFLFGYLIFEYRQAAVVMGLTILAALAVSVSADIESTEWLSAVTVVASFIAIWLAISWPSARSRVSLFLGDVSYPLYLIHVPLMLGVTGYFGLSAPWVLSAAALVMAIVTLECVEKPFRRQLRRIGSVRA